MEHIRKVLQFGGVAFLVIRFTGLEKNFLLLGEDLLSFVDNEERKSIPLEYFENKGYRIEIKYAPRLDYIKIIDKILKMKEVNLS